jgi:hypothetical protein
MVLAAWSGTVNKLCPCPLLSTKPWRVIGSVGVAPLIPVIGPRWVWVVSFMPQPVYSQGKRPPVLRADLDILEQRNILSSCRESTNKGQVTLYGTARHDTAQHDTTRHDTTWPNILVWFWYALIQTSLSPTGDDKDRQRRCRLDWKKIIFCLSFNCR